jgi:hypothetical protein
MAIINSAKLNYSKGVFTVEASDLGPAPIFHNLYKNAADVGITIISSRTGAEAHYFLYARNLDAHGEVVSWSLAPTYETIQRLPGAALTRVTILND